MAQGAHAKLLSLLYLYCHLYIKNSYSENVPNVCEPRAMASVQGCACECEGSSKHAGSLSRSGCAILRVLAFGESCLYSCLHCTSILQLQALWLLAALHTLSIMWHWLETTKMVCLQDLSVRTQLYCVALIFLCFGHSSCEHISLVFEGV